MTMLLKPTIIILISLIILTGLIAGAEASGPGDILHPLDLGLEQLRLSLTSSRYDRAQLQIEYADERAKELEDMLEAEEPIKEAYVEQMRQQYDDALTATAQLRHSQQIELATQLKTSLQKHLRTMQRLELSAGTEILAQILEETEIMSVSATLEPLASDGEPDQDQDRQRDQDCTDCDQTPDQDQDRDQDRIGQPDDGTLLDEPLILDSKATQLNDNFMFEYALNWLMRYQLQRTELYANRLMTQLQANQMPEQEDLNRLQQRYRLTLWLALMLREQEQQQIMSQIQTQAQIQMRLMQEANCTECLQVMERIQAQIQLAFDDPQLVRAQWREQVQYMIGRVQNNGGNNPLPEQVQIQQQTGPGEGQSTDPGGPPTQNPDPPGPSGEGGEGGDPPGPSNGNGNPSGPGKKGN